MIVRVLAFARVAEVCGARDFSLELDPGARAADIWRALVSRAPEIDELRATTRIARNGRMASLDEELENGDEVALLPPVGGG